MHRILNLSLLFILSLFSIYSFAEKQNQTELSVSEIINSKTQIVTYFDDEFAPRNTPATKGGYYRKVLGETATGWYVIQDYYQQSNKKQTDPFIIKNEQDLRNSEPTSVEGDLIFWHPNGKKSAEAHYLNDERDGTWTWWYHNGQREAEENYTNNQLDGLSTTWYSNGKKKSEENYLDGKLEGLSTFWNEKGKKESETLYKNNKPVLPEIVTDEIQTNTQ